MVVVLAMMVVVMSMMNHDLDVGGDGAMAYDDIDELLSVPRLARSAIASQCITLTREGASAARVTPGVHGRKRDGARRQPGYRGASHGPT